MPDRRLAGGIPAGTDSEPPGAAQSFAARALFLRRAIDLFAPESLRPDLRLALRGVLGLMAPIVLGHALALPALDLVGLGAYLLTFSDVSGTAVPRQFVRLALGSALGAVALISGAIAGSHAAAAIGGMLAWGLIVGLFGAYGDAGAAMGLPLAWAYCVLGLSAPVHDPWHAAGIAALYFGGGLWAMTLAAAINTVGRYGPLRQRTADCYTSLATYLEGAFFARDLPPPSGPIAPETRVRQTIAAARLLAARTRRGQLAASDLGPRLLALIELANRLFLLGAAHKDSLALSAATSADVLLLKAIRNIPVVLTGRASAAATDSLARRLEHLLTLDAANDADGLRGRMAGVALNALRLAAADVTPPAPIAGAVEIERIRAHFLDPLRACLSWHSLVLRHALRFGLLAAVAVAVQQFWNPPFGYWIPLTVTVLLRPYAGTTRRRAAQRLSGTVGGVFAGLALAASIGSGWAVHALFATVAFFLLLATLPINYAWAVFFLSVGMIPLEVMLSGASHWQAGLFRIINTGVGGAIALLGGQLLWPASETTTLAPMAAGTLRAMAGFATALLAAPASAAAREQAHRQAGLMNSNLQAAFQRTMDELAHEPERFEAIELAVTTLQRLLLSLNTLRVVGKPPELNSAAGKRFTAEVVATLGSLGDALEHAVPPAPPSSLEDALQALRRTLAKQAGEMSLASIALSRVGQDVLMLHAATARLAPSRGAAVQ